MKVTNNKLKQQNGSALAVSLVILLVLTILGVNSMSSLVLEERMAGNTRQSMVAAQAADTALRTAENWIRTTINSPAATAQFTNGAAQGLYQQLPAAFDVSVNANWVPGVSSVAVPLQGVNPPGAKAQLVGQNPQYVIEYIGVAGLPALNPQNPSVNTRPHAFRITAIGFGEDPNARFLAQSTYRKNL